MKMIITAGMPGSGKEEFLIAAQNLGIPFLRMGDIVREYHAKRSKDDESLSVGQLANIERERYGFDIWAKRAMEKMYGNIFLIDGCRSRDEVRAYLNITSDVKVIAIHASPSTRYARLIKRARDDAPADIKEFEARDSRELGWGLGDTIALADEMIINEGTLEEFHISVQQLMSRMSE